MEKHLTVWAINLILKGLTLNHDYTYRVAKRIHDNDNLYFEFWDQLKNGYSGKIEGLFTQIQKEVQAQVKAEQALNEVKNVLGKYNATLSLSGDDIALGVENRLFKVVTSCGVINKNSKFELE